MVISLLVPSRARPSNITRLFQSLYDCSPSEEWELLVRLDNDDSSIYPDAQGVRYFRGLRTTMSVYWNELADIANGDILWHGGDDVVFRTIGWDSIIRDAFPPDNIAFVHGHDLSPNGHWLGTHGFLSRRWVDTVGYFVPPYFSSDYNDVWLVDVADLIDRHVYIPVVTEHLHPSHGKAEWDITHQERITRHTADDMDGLYRSPEMVQNRLDDAAKLREVMS